MRRCTFMQCELMLNFLHPVDLKSNHTFTNLNTGWIIGNTRGSGLQVRFYKVNWFHIAFLWGELNTYWSNARSDIKLLQVSHMTVHNKMCIKSKPFFVIIYRLLGLLKLKFEHLQESGMHKLFVSFGSQNAEDKLVFKTFYTIFVSALDPL